MLRHNPLLRNLPKPKKIIDGICQLPSKKKTRKELLKELGFANSKKKKWRSEAQRAKKEKSKKKSLNLQKMKKEEKLVSSLIRDLRYVIASVPFKIRIEEGKELKTRLREFAGLINSEEVIEKVFEPEKLNAAYIKLMEVLYENGYIEKSEETSWQ